MDFWKYVGESNDIIFWIAIGIVLFVLGITPLLKKHRDKKLLKTVTSPNRGTKSERDLVLQLLKYGVPAQTIFHDLYVEKNNGEFSQIDVVVATTQGIIVFEVKDYSGWIFGNGSYSHWTQVLAYGKKKYRFYNPIKQNQSHIRVLRKRLNQLVNVPFFSIIAFYGDCTLKEINYVPAGTFLAKSSRIMEVLRTIKTDNEAAPYTHKKELVDFLKQAMRNGESISNQQKHIENVNGLLGKNRIFDS
ncbi:MAG: nuclease-related domain-containing protein [Cyclobacteriaceae bacterium]